MDAIYPSLLATINNVAPYLEQLNHRSSSRLLQLFASMSAPSFLLANETNYALLQSLLESMNAIVEHQYRSKSHNPLSSGSHRAHQVRQQSLYPRNLQIPQAFRSPPLLHPRKRPRRNTTHETTQKRSCRIL